MNLKTSFISFEELITPYEFLNLQEELSAHSRSINTHTKN